MSADLALERAVDEIAELLAARIGLRPEPTVRARLRRCVRDEAEGLRCGVGGISNVVRSNPDAYQSLVDRVTVQETSFFRHPEQFAVLAGQILQKLAPPVTLWSAGCANGQEAVSLAILLEEAGIDGRVIATDVSKGALARTTSGRYTSREISGLSDDRKARYLSRVGHEWQVAESLQRRVTVLRHNLIDPIPAQLHTAQVVLCRNVLIYFSSDHARALLDQIADRLPDAVVLLGAAESVWSLNERFDAVHEGEAFLYRVRRPGRTPATSATPPPITVPTKKRELQSGATADAALRLPEETATLARTGQGALDSGDPRAAIMDFRKLTFLTPANPLAHLHLGLALEASGDQRSAQRAFAAARRALLISDPADLEYATEGYSGASVLRLLDDKQETPR